MGVLVQPPAYTAELHLPARDTVQQPAVSCDADAAARECQAARRIFLLRDLKTISAL